LFDRKSEKVDEALAMACVKKMGIGNSKGKKKVSFIQKGKEGKKTSTTRPEQDCGDNGRSDPLKMTGR